MNINTYSLGLSISGTPQNIDAVLYDLFALLPQNNSLVELKFQRESICELFSFINQDDHRKKLILFAKDISFNARIRFFNVLTEILSGQTLQERNQNLSFAFNHLEHIETSCKGWMFAVAIDSRGVFTQSQPYKLELILHVVPLLAGYTKNVDHIIECLATKPGLFERIRHCIPTSAPAEMALFGLVLAIENIKDAEELKPLLNHCLCSPELVYQEFAKMQDRGHILRHMRTLLCQNYTGEELVVILQALSGCPEEAQGYLKDAIKIAKAFSKDSSDSVGFEFLIETLNRIPPKCKKTILERVKKFNDNSLSNTDLARIIILISMITDEDWKDVLSLAKPIHKFMNSNNDKVELLWLIHIAPDDTRAEIFNQVGHYLRNNKAGFSLSFITCACTHAISPDQWQKIKEITDQIICANDSPFTIWGILCAVCKIPESNRQAGVKRAIPFLETLSFREYAGEWIEQIALISDDEIEEVQKHAERFLKNSDLTDLTRCHFMESINRLNREERSIVLDLIDDMIPANSKSSDILFILLKTLLLSESQRIPILRQTKKIINNQGACDDVERVIELLESVPTGARESLLQRIQPNLTSIAEISERLDFLQECVDEAIQQLGCVVIVSRDELMNAPRKVLADFIQTLKNQNPPKYFLDVEFVGEPGIDESGLSKEFLSLLFAQTVASLGLKVKDNGLCMPTLSMDEDDLVTYRNIGELMMFCINSQRDHPLGMQFDYGLFLALTQLKQHHILQSFESVMQNEKHFQELVDIYTRMNSPTGIISATMEALKRAAAILDNESVQEAFTFALLEYDTKDIDKANVALVQQEVRKFIVNDFLKLELVPIIEIARGMFASPYAPEGWDLMQKMAPDALSEKIQGRLTSELALSKLVFEDVPAKKQAWVRNWIASAPYSLLKKFAFRITGSFGLGNKNIIIRSINTICYKTCSNTLALPFALIENEASFCKIIQDSLNDPLMYTRE